MSLLRVTMNLLFFCCYCTTILKCTVESFTTTTITTTTSYKTSLLPYQHTTYTVDQNSKRGIFLSVDMTTTRLYSSSTTPSEDEEDNEITSTTAAPDSNNDKKLGMMMDVDSTVLFSTSSSSTTTTTTTTTTPSMTGSRIPLSSSTTTASAQFGDVVPLKRPTANIGQDGNTLFPTQSTTISSSLSSSSSTTMRVEDDDPLKTVRRRNIQVAILSIGLACMQYLWQYLHPLEPISLLYEMQQKSSPITVLGNTNKPTVIDFWAPWCENCKQLAPTLYQVEQTYSSSINFVMVNADAPDAWPLIEAFGVDAIPHLALVEADGTVDTALIGLVPKQWLIEDFDVLTENAKILSSTTTSASSSSSETSTPPPRRPLPFQMLDVFANRPDQRRIQVVIPEDQ